MFYLKKPINAVYWLMFSETGSINPEKTPV